MDIADAEVGQAVLYKAGTRMQRTGVVTSVNMTTVAVDFLHDQTGEMSADIDPADLEVVTPTPELS